MISYTDHILSNFPHTFLKMCDTPLAIDDSTSSTRKRYFLDWSSNRNHNFYITDENVEHSSNYFSNSGYFKDSTPLGGISLPSSPAMGASYVYQAPGPLFGKTLFNQSSFPESKYQYQTNLYYFYSIYSKYKHNKHVKVEFFLNSNFMPPYAGCKLGGEIYAPMIKVGPISFWNSYYWESAGAENSCVTPDRTYENSYDVRYLYPL